MVKPAVVIPAYKRTEPLRRLLDSVIKNDQKRIEKIIISLDGGYEPKVGEIAKFFSNIDSRVEIIYQPHNLGLRDHLLKCLGLCSVYECVVVLEDDLIVSPGFFNLCEFYAGSLGVNDDYVGASLYAYQYNEFADQPFSYDNWLASDFYSMLVPSSWGTVVHKNSWSAFENWLKCHNRVFPFVDDRMPEVVQRWPASSWKKLLFAYMIEKQKFFLFYKSSACTNCGSPSGTHMKTPTNLYQVSLMPILNDVLEFEFNSDIYSLPVYDSHMEPSASYLRCLGFQLPLDTAISFYGSKSVDLLCQSEFALIPSWRLHEGKVVKRFPYGMRPPFAGLNHEGNIDETTPHYVLVKCAETKINSVTKWKKRYSEISNFYFGGKNFYIYVMHRFIRKFLEKIFK